MAVAVGMVAFLGLDVVFVVGVAALDVAVAVVSRDGGFSIYRFGCGGRTCCWHCLGTCGSGGGGGRSGGAGGASLVLFKLFELFFWLKPNLCQTLL